MNKYNFMNKGSLQKKNKKSVTFVILGGGSRSVFVILFKNMFKMCSNNKWIKNEFFFKKNFRYTFQKIGGVRPK